MCLYPNIRGNGCCRSGIGFSEEKRRQRKKKGV